MNILILTFMTYHSDCKIVVGKGRLMSLACLPEILYPAILVLSAQYL